MLLSEELPSSIHGATVVAGTAPSLVDDALLDGCWEDPEARISSSRTQTACSVPGGGRFWVERGERVVVQAGDGDRPVPWLHATVGAFVLAQQGRFALHANIVEVNGTVMAICGRRGAGKSTTSLALASAGHHLITDDVATLDLDGRLVVHPPAGRPVHIHPATAGRLGVSIEAGRPVAGDPSKVALVNPACAPVDVGAIVVLRRDPNGVADVRLARLSAAAGAQAVHRHAYRRGLLAEVWGAELFRWAAAIADRVPVWRLVRPATEWTVASICATLEDLDVSRDDR